MTRKALSEAMKFTVRMRGSRSTVASRCLRNNDPLAPVVAIVRFCGGRLGNGSSEVGRLFAAGRWRTDGGFKITTDHQRLTATSWQRQIVWDRDGTQRRCMH